LIISIECRADALFLSPAGMRMLPSTLQNAPPADNPLSRAVQEIIDRRQAAVPQGELPYRVRIRFLVRPDGLRSYYDAYPALESLHVPMTRENLPGEK
jgi:hypothetical protein